MPCHVPVRGKISGQSAMQRFSAFMSPRPLRPVKAAIGIHQLKKVERFQKRRQAIAMRYTEEFSDLPLRTPVARNPEDTHSWHLYVIQLELEKLSIDRDAFIEKMAEKGIGTSVHFIPLHIHPYWRDQYGLKPEDFPVAYDCFRRAVSLPIYSKMTDGDVERVVTAVKDVICESGRAWGRRRCRSLWERVEIRRLEEDGKLRDGEEAGYQAFSRSDCVSAGI